MSRARRNALPHQRRAPVRFPPGPVRTRQVPPARRAHRRSGERTAPCTSSPSVEGQERAREGEFSPRCTGSRTQKGMIRAVVNVVQEDRRRLRPRQGLIPHSTRGAHSARHLWTRGAHRRHRPVHRHSAHAHQGVPGTLADIAVRTGRSGRSARHRRRAGRCARRGRPCAPDVRGAVHGERTTSSVRAPDAGMPRTHRWRRRRRRTDHHGFDRPPGYCGERRRTGGGSGDAYSATRSRDASASR